MTDSFDLAAGYVDELCGLRPTMGTVLGIGGYDHLWPDEGMTGVEAHHLLVKRHLALNEPEVSDPDWSRSLAARVAVGKFGEAVSGYEAQDHYRDLSHMASTFHSLGSIFDLMAVDTDEERGNIRARLETIDQPYSGLIERLDEGRARGVVVASRQVESVILQAKRRASSSSPLDLLLAHAGMETGVAHAKAQAGRFAQYLETKYLPDANPRDAVGEEVYIREADRMLGMSIDPHEIYRWGWEEFARLRSEMLRLADAISPGDGLLEVKDKLETDPDGLAYGTDQLLAFVDRTLTDAVKSLSGTHFDVPVEIEPLTSQIAPAGRPLGVYYMRPSEDLSRPGGVWYSIGDQTEFPLYQHVSTAYHEGFPGHHLQLATAVYRRDELSRIQRLATWYPGFSEGWAMYAEVLMGELGYLEDPRYHFGMLAKQMYRAARIVVDIGLHLEKDIDPSSPMTPGEQWTFERAVDFMATYGFRTPDQAEAEVLRYLGWPGQAITYKVGEREILSIRDDAARRLGPAFDLKEFHTTVLNNGTMRLDLLREVVEERLR